MSRSVDDFRTWLGNWGKGILSEPDPNMLVSALVEFGAKFGDLSEDNRRRMGKYSNATRAPAMRAIWGDRFDRYKVDAKQWLDEYEIHKGVSLPALKKSGQKTSGLIQVFGEITALATGPLTFEVLAPFLDARRHNGILWMQGRKDERIRLVTPNAKDEAPKLVSSVPPGFELFIYSTLTGWTGQPWNRSAMSEDEEEE